MTHSDKTWNDFNSLNPELMTTAALYEYAMSKFKKPGTNLTPKKKKRKKRK